MPNILKIDSSGHYSEIAPGQLENPLPSVSYFGGALLCVPRFNAVFLNDDALVRETRLHTVLATMLPRPRQIITKDELAQKLWPTTYEERDKKSLEHAVGHAVRRTKYNLDKLLGLEPERSKLISVHRGLGFIFDPSKADVSMLSTGFNDDSQLTF